MSNIFIVLDAIENIKFPYDPAGMYNNAVASLGDVVINSNQDLTGLINRYDTLTIDETFTLSVPSSQNGAFIIADEIIVNGSISASGRGLSGGSTTTGTNVSGNPGSGDSNALGGSGAAGGGTSGFGSGGNGGESIAGAGGLGDKNTGNPGTDTNVINIQNYEFWNPANVNLMVGAGGGSGSRFDGPNGGAGGAGGGFLYIICNKITISASGSILSNGIDGAGAGAGGGALSGAGGGGGGGIIFLSSAEISTFGTISAFGGTGGVAVGNNGGNGGDGVVLIYEW